jgi:SAM-dependent methyltransferase
MREPEPAEADPIAARARSFGAVAASYAAVRPDWPAPTAAWLVAADLPGRDRPLDVLDLGAGTGKLTATLVAAGHRVMAADADAAMLAQLRQDLPQVPVHVAGAEALPLPDAGFDAVTVAQAWHWFDPAAAAAECARVLRPGGVLGIGWHRLDDRVPWLAELTEITGRQQDAVAPSRDGGVRLPPPFGPVAHAVLAYQLRTSPAGLRQLAGTWSYVNTSPRLQQILDGVEALARRVAGPDGGLTVPHLTHCYRAVRH